MEPRPPEKSTTREITDTAVEVGLSLVPVVGGAFATAWAAAVGHAYSERLNDWLADLAAAVEEATRDIAELDLTTIASNPLFLDAVAKATRAAEATHDLEKIAALRNAVLNATLPDAPDAVYQAIFLRLVDEMTSSHLRLLALLDDPTGWFEERDIPWPNLMMGGWSTIVEQGMPEWVGQRGFYDLIAKHLSDSGLILISGLHTTQTGGSLSQSVTSPLGKEFLRYITDPRQAT